MLDLDGRITKMFEDRRRWTQFRFARDMHGDPINFRAEEATCWCLLGAINKFYRGRSAVVVDLVLVKMQEMGIPPSIVTFNDNSDHPTVLAFCRRINL